MKKTGDYADKHYQFITPDVLTKPLLVFLKIPL